MICLIYLINYLNHDLKDEFKNLAHEIVLLYIVISIFLKFIENRINKFLKLIYFENFKIKKLLKYNSRQLEGFNFMEFVWFNNEKNYINNNLKEFLCQNKDILMKGNEEMVSSSGSNSSIIRQKSNNGPNSLQVLSGIFYSFL